MLPLLPKKEIFSKVRFGESNTGEDSEFLRQCKEHKIKIYSSDPYNWVHVRKKKNDFHTWEIDDKDLLKSAVKLNKIEVDKDIFLHVESSKD